MKIQTFISINDSYAEQLESLSLHIDCEGANDKFHGRKPFIRVRKLIIGALGNHTCEDLLVLLQLFPVVENLEIISSMHSNIELLTAVLYCCQHLRALSICRKQLDFCETNILPVGSLATFLPKEQLWINSNVVSVKVDEVAECVPTEIHELKTHLPNCSSWLIKPVQPKAKSKQRAPFLQI